MKGVNIFLADGFEDCEALATNDVLKRGGVNVQFVSISDDPFVQSSHGVTVGVENFIDELDLEDHRGTDAGDFMIFPGGMPGSKNLASCRKLIKAMQAHYDAGGSLAAICAAPGLVLGQLKDLEGVEFTCFDSFEDGPKAKGAIFKAESAVSCGRIVTGRSAGWSFSFGLAILAKIKGEEVASKVAHDLFLQ